MSLPASPCTSPCPGPDPLPHPKKRDRDPQVDHAAAHSREFPGLFPSMFITQPSIGWCVIIIFYTYLQVFDFELTEEEMKTILGFNRNWRVCPMQWWDRIIKCFFLKIFSSELGSSLWLNFTFFYSRSLRRATKHKDYPFNAEFWVGSGSLHGFVSGLSAPVIAHFPVL